MARPSKLRYRPLENGRVKRTIKTKMELRREVYDVLVEERCRDSKMCLMSYTDRDQWHTRATSAEDFIPPFSPALFLDLLHFCPSTHATGFSGWQRAAGPGEERGMVATLTGRQVEEEDTPW